MRERLVKQLLERTLPDTRPDECFFSSGPPAVVRHPADARKLAALLAELRRPRVAA